MWPLGPGEELLLLLPLLLHPQLLLLQEVQCGRLWPLMQARLTTTALPLGRLHGSCLLVPHWHKEGRLA